MKKSAMTTLNSHKKHSYHAKPLEDGSYIITRPGCPCCARLIAPKGSFPEKEALDSLMDFASTTSAGGTVPIAAAATPDLHPNTPIPVGSVLLTPENMAIPSAIGKDINCGMRLVRFTIPLEEAKERIEAIIKALRDPLLEARRNIPLSGSHFAALFEEGPLALAKMVLPSEGLWQKMNRQSLEKDYAASPYQGLFRGASRFAPEMLLEDRLIREPGLGTLGSGNHFFELQQLDTALNPSLCWQHGMDKRYLYALIHTGSRDVGHFVGSRFMSAAKEAWPKDRPYPETGIFAVEGDLAKDYMSGMSVAAHYAWLNRSMLQEMARQALTAALGRDIEAVCIADVPHNVVTQEQGGLVHRKGATPAWDGALCLIPGSMGDYSFAAVGMGNDASLSSCSHGSGRSSKRSKSRVLSDESKLPFRIETLKSSRFLEERPAAYMDIEPAIGIQEDMGILTPCARFAPLATFKA